MNASNKGVISLRDIISSFAFCATAQSPYPCPHNFNEAIAAVAVLLRDKYDFDIEDKMASKNYKILTREQVTDIVKSIIFDVPEVKIWNLTQYEIELGFTDPDDDERPVKFGVASRYSHPKAYYDFVDLHALEQNVFGMIMGCN